MGARAWLTLTVPALLIVALTLELVCRTLLPAAEFPAARYDPTDQVLKYDPTHASDGVYTMGAPAFPRGRWHINQAGWNNPEEYGPRTARPRIAVIGDSYVEALQVDVADSLGPQLAQRLQPHDVEVYTFGISGASLAQYLQMARMVWRRYQPDLLVLMVVHNDFAESLCAVKHTPGMRCLDVESATVTERPITPYRPSTLARFLRHSSLIRYLVVNLKLPALVRAWQRTDYAANVAVPDLVAHRQAIPHAVRYVLTTLRAEAPECPLLVVLDAPRDAVYANTVHQSPVWPLHRVLEDATARLAIPFVDLTHALTAHYAQHRLPFEFAQDGHWNVVGHRVVADTLAPIIAPYVALGS